MARLYIGERTKEPKKNLYVISECLLFLRLQILRTMPVNPQHITLMRQLVEESANHTVTTSNDFIFLSGEIQGRLKETLSASTLKRLWGYVEGYASVRPSTLDILARFVGFPDWETFVSDYCEVESVQSSHRVVSKSLYTKDLDVDNQVEIAWNPNRRCKLKYLGNSLFEVVTSENAKLKPGDRFLCQRFTKNQPLYVELITNDGNTELFVMGNKGGLTKLTLPIPTYTQPAT